MSDGILIVLLLASITVVPVAIVFSVVALGRWRRRKKVSTYKGRADGRILSITKRGIDSPFVISVGYRVNGVSYEIRETAKLKSHAIKVGPLPIGQRKTFVLGPVKEGDLVTVYYDEANPRKAIIFGNDGSVTT